MRLIHSYDPSPGDDRALTTDEIKAAIQHAHTSMWEYVALGEFDLALVCERARDRLLLALHARLTA